jgi:hypothetical protein
MRQRAEEHHRPHQAAQDQQAGHDKAGGKSFQRWFPLAHPTIVRRTRQTLKPNLFAISRGLGVVVADDARACAGGPAAAEGALRSHRLPQNEQ